MKETHYVIFRFRKRHSGLYAFLEEKKVYNAQNVKKLTNI